MNLDDVLSGRAKLEGIQWLLLSASPRRVLRDQLKSLLSSRSLLGPCRLRRATYKPGRKLTAYYDVLVRTAGSAACCSRPIAVTWEGNGESNQRSGEHYVSEIEAEARRRGVAGPFRKLKADVVPWNMHISVSPLDIDFIQLVRLIDPSYASDMLAVAYQRSGLALDRSRRGKCTVISIRYRPGQRHVLRYDRLGAEKTAVFAKLYSGEDGGRVFQIATQATEWLAQRAKGVAAVRPLAFMPEHNVLLYPGLRGTPLTESLPRRDRDLARSLEHTGTALHALHLLPPAVAGPLPSHDFAAEVRQTARASAHIRVLLPPVGAVISALLDRARELHNRLPQEPPTLTHGDFKSEHVWCGPGGLTLLDFDSCHCGDPALDIGKFLAHLQLWHVLNDQPGLGAAQEQFLTGYAGSMPRERLARARLYEAVELIKITARRVPLFGPDWTLRTERLIGRAHYVMNDVELMLGPPATRTSPVIPAKERAAHA